MSHSLACAEGHHRAAKRRAADVLSERQIDAIVAHAIDDGDGSYEGIQAALREARELASDGVVLDERGHWRWPY